MQRIRRYSVGRQRINRYSAGNASKDTGSDQHVVEERDETNETDVGISRHALSDSI
jgi:hypothetical protein